jgi:hypothetical protein
MKHWKDRGLNRPLVFLRSLDGTAFEIQLGSETFVGHTHCPDVIREMLTWGAAAQWFFDVCRGGNEFHIVALGKNNSKRWFSFSRKQVPDCGAAPHGCKAQTEKEG